MSALTELPDPIQASMLEYRTRGRDRAIYDIVGFPTLLAKVAASDPQRLRKVFAHEERFLRTRSEPDLPVARILGHRQTAHGPAQISERIVDAKGRIAPSLADLLKSNAFTPDHLSALNTFARHAIDGHIPLSDFDFRNLVYGTRDGDTAPRVYVVDGFGDKSYIQIKRWFRWANTPHVVRKFDRTPRGGRVTWNRRARRFEML